MAAKVLLVTEQDLIIDVLSQYRELPVLWDITHKDYKVREARKQAYASLLENYRKYDQTATVQILIKKIENMRAAYRREKKKVEKGIVDGEPYRPKLWYYSYLRFLDEDYCHSDSDVTYEPLHKRLKMNEHGETPAEQQNEEDDVIALSPGTCGDDETAEAFGKSITCTLKELPKLQRCLAEKLIGEVIFYAKMDKLNMDSMIYLHNDDDDDDDGDGDGNAE